MSKDKAVKTTPEVDQALAVQQQNVMLASYDELMAGTSSTIELKDGRKVTLHSAKVKHLRQITEFVAEFVTSFEENKLVGLIMRVSDRQEQRLKEGTDPFSLNTQQIVRELAGEFGILAQLVNGGFGRIGGLAAIFSDLPADEFEELDVDEAAALLLGIFGRNYAFFIQQVRPLVLGYIARLLSQGKSLQGNSPKSAPSKQEKSKGK